MTTREAPSTFVLDPEAAQAIVKVVTEPLDIAEIIAGVGFPACSRWAQEAGYASDGLGVLGFMREALTTLCREGRISPWKSYRFQPYLEPQDPVDAFAERMVARTLSKGNPGDPFTPGRRLASLEAAAIPRCQCRAGGRQCDRMREGTDRWCSGCRMTRDFGKTCGHAIDPEKGL